MFIITKDETEIFATSMFTDREKCAKMLECIRSRPLKEELQKKENITVGMVYAYESGLKEGKKEVLDDIAQWVQKYSISDTNGIPFVAKSPLLTFIQSMCGSDEE